MSNTPLVPRSLELDPDELEMCPALAEFQTSRIPPCGHEDEYAMIQSQYDYLQARNVFLCTPDGMTILAGVLQQGSITVNAFYRWMEMIFSSPAYWYLRRHHNTNSLQPNIADNVLSRDDMKPIEAGKYVTIDSEGKYLTLTPSNLHYMPRIISRIFTPPNLTEYAFAEAVLRRSSTCEVTRSSYEYFFGSDETTQISHTQVVGWTHIFPTAYVDEWKQSGLASDMVDYNSSQSPTKLLNSHQNGLTLKDRLRTAFDLNRIAVDVDNNYRVVALDPTFSLKELPDARINFDFVNGTNHAPPSSLLRSHFKQGLYRYVLGSGNLDMADSDRHAYTLHGGYARLDEECWLVGVGKTLLEAFLATKLFGCLPCFDTEDERNPRMKETSRKKIMELQTPPESEWPDSFEDKLVPKNYRVWDATDLVFDEPIPDEPWYPVVHMGSPDDYDLFDFITR